MNYSNIILIGFMGTGKSTVGKILAERLSWSFVDSDHAIEQQEQMKIRDIFSNQSIEASLTY
jgi:shikimate kinase